MKKPSPNEREALLISLLMQLFTGEITEGQLLRTLRKDLLNMSQTEYAALVKVSRRTLSDTERDTGSQSLAVLNAIFRPFGLKAGLLPRNPALMKKLLAEDTAPDSTR
ncbi:helix-turn-helix domain-containing protein [Oceanisphaera ostreae]|uniref:Helix-turn-helix domain-containing protein n=1 Tax=Oceanisphaera ostreae TaxID=914151 RepID=A0ABW3KDH0_9GAMM